MESRYWIELGPGGRSRVYNMDGTPVSAGSCNERSESNQEDGMTVSEALERIDELREEIARLGGDELAENRSTSAFMPTRPYHADNDGDGEDGESTNEASGTEGASASGGFMEPTPYHEDN